MLPFSLARLPRIEFGRGTFSLIPELLQQFGSHVLLVTGGQSFQSSRFFTELGCGLSEQGLKYSHYSVEAEPSPSQIDDAVAMYADSKIDVVLGVGGGSALDAAKAIAGLLALKGASVMDYLEGIGPELTYTGPAIPFVAVPTTAGTGSEATRNAVLSLQGQNGYKKSFRDEQLVAEYAVVDPALLMSCPADVIAANGMDALTQLLESYVSLKANAFSDALALSGIEAVSAGLLAWYAGGEQAIEAQEHMAYAALNSGITLAQVGLGSVHGLASPLGAFYPIPHGVACGAVLAAATGVNIHALQARRPGDIALKKYAGVARILCQRSFESDRQACAGLVDLLADWTRQLNIPSLGDYGVTESGIPELIENCSSSSMKTNPVLLSDDEVAEVLRLSL